MEVSKDGTVAVLGVDRVWVGRSSVASRRVTKRDFMEMEIVPSCYYYSAFFETFGRMTIAPTAASASGKASEIQCEGEASASSAQVGEGEEEIHKNGENEEEKFHQSIVVGEGEVGGVELGKAESVVLLPDEEVRPGKFQLDPQDFVDFENEEEIRFVSIACGDSQPHLLYQEIIMKKDACVGNSQPEEENEQKKTSAALTLVDSCVGSSQPLVEMKDEAVETTRVEMKNLETMTTSPEVLLKRCGNGGFYAENEVPNSKKARRSILGSLCNNNSSIQAAGQQQDVDFGLNNSFEGKRTLLYPSQMNHGLSGFVNEDGNTENEFSAAISTTVRVPVLRVGLSKKVRPPRLLQYRSVPEPCRMHVDDYNEDAEDKEN